MVSPGEFRRAMHSRLLPTHALLLHSAVVALLVFEAVLIARVAQIRRLPDQSRMKNWLPPLSKCQAFPRLIDLIELALVWHLESMEAWNFHEWMPCLSSESRVYRGFPAAAAQSLSCHCIAVEEGA